MRSMLQLFAASTHSVAWCEMESWVSHCEDCAVLLCVVTCCTSTIIIFMAGVLPLASLEH